MHSRCTRAIRAVTAAGVVATILAGGNAAFAKPDGGAASDGSASDGGAARAVTVTTTERAVRPRWLQPRAVGDTPGAAGAGQRAAGACDTRVTGNWSYRDAAGARHNAMNVKVEVWDYDVYSGADLLAVGLTDGVGNYNICFDANADTAPETGTADVFVRFVTENRLWMVRLNGIPMFSDSTTAMDVVPGTTRNLGALGPYPELDRGWRAFDQVNDAWLFVPMGGCFDPKETTNCRQLVVDWGPVSTAGPRYSGFENVVYLSATDPDRPLVVLHEVAHAIVDDVYQDAFPPAANCSVRQVTAGTSPACALWEGVADWFASSVTGDPRAQLADGTTVDLEHQTWGNSWADGEGVEGRVAGALIDLTDTVFEGPWDRYGEGVTNIWTTVTRRMPASFGALWSARSLDGFNVTYAGAMASVYQNTIDVGFRDPLGDYQPLSRPTPNPPHNYVALTNTPYWSVVAVRPPSGADYDLQMWADRAQTALLANSAYGGSTVDFVAVDTNRRPTGAYFPRIYRYSGSGPYQVEFAQGAQQLPVGTVNVAMGPQSVVAVRDTMLAAGTPATISLTPLNGQECELFLLFSDPTNPTSWVQGRSAAVASSTTAGPGAFQQITFTPTVTAWYGVVVVTKDGSGSYTLTRS